MQVLEQAGFIKTISIGGQKYTYVFLVHPTTVIESLRASGKINDPNWLRAYEEIQRESKELTFVERNKARRSQGKVVPINQPSTKKKRSPAI